MIEIPYGNDCLANCRCHVEPLVDEEETFLCLGCEHTYLMAEAASISGYLRGRHVGRCRKPECSRVSTVSDDEALEAGRVLKAITTEQAWRDFLGGVSAEAVAADR